MKIRDNAAKAYSPAKMGTAVLWWLSYSSAMGREYVLNESAIKFPIAEYLDRTDVKEVKLEVPHPTFQLKRCDLSFITADGNDNICEFKYIHDNSNDNKQLIFDDLMRLYFSLGNYQRAYFLICGQQLDFNSSFMSIPEPSIKSAPNQPYIIQQTTDSKKTRPQPKGFFTDWFKFDIDNPIQEMEQINNKEYFDDFLKRYEEPYKKIAQSKLKLPDKIATKFVFLSDNAEQHTTAFLSSKVGIWEVIIP